MKNSDALGDYFSKWGMLKSWGGEVGSGEVSVTYMNETDAQRLLERTMAGEQHIIKGRNVTIQVQK